MALESASFLDGLITSNPDGGADPKSGGDDHLRLLKTVLKATFPGFAGRIMRTQTKSGNYALALNDNHTLLKFTATAALTSAPAGTLGNGWAAYVHVAAGTTTFTPQAPATINGAVNLVLPGGSSWFIVCDGTNFLAFPMGAVLQASAGVRMLFQQSSAPVGWTKVTSTAFNEAAIRLVTGNTTTGGVDAFSTHFGASKKTGGTAITVAQMPAHGHSGTTSTVGDHTHGGGATLPGQGTPGGAFPVVPNLGNTGAAGSHNHSFNTANTGGGAVHDHTITGGDIKYVDCIIAVKD